MGIHYQEPDAIELVSKEIINAIGNTNKRISVLCIGTDRCTGDSLGPLVGYFLKYSDIKVYGTLENPVHAENIEKIAKNIPEDEFVIAVDASLGHFWEVGEIKVARKGIEPGSGMDKTINRVGDIAVEGIIGGIVAPSKAFEVLRNTRLHLVMSMAEVLADAVRLAVERYDINRVLRREHTA